MPRVYAAVKEDRLVSPHVGDQEVIDSLGQRGRGGVGEGSEGIAGFPVGVARDGKKRPRHAGGRLRPSGRQALGIAPGEQQFEMLRR
jgi:hypothetical protein